MYVEVPLLHTRASATENGNQMEYKTKHLKYKTK